MRENGLNVEGKHTPRLASGLLIDFFEALRTIFPGNWKAGFMPRSQAPGFFILWQQDGIVLA
jgi:hypothetical protein